MLHAGIFSPFGRLDRARRSVSVATAQNISDAPFWQDITKKGDAGASPLSGADLTAC